MSEERVEIEMHYELGHSYPEAWTRTELFCPSCGKQSVWNELGNGDYYMGTQYLCECGASFYAQGVGSPENWQDLQRMAAFRGENPHAVARPDGKPLAATYPRGH